MTQTLAFRRFGPDHIDAAVRLSLAAGWPHRHEDWALLVSLGRGHVALHRDTVVATALATPMGDLAMANMIIVDATMRGRGLGRQIMERSLELLAPQEWRLTATELGLPLYRKLGFESWGTVHQHQAVLPTLTVLTAPAGVRLATAANLPAIAAMDLAATGADRAALLARLCANGRVAFAEGHGFAVLHEFGRGGMVGPVVAQDQAVAQDLLTFLLAGQAGRFVRVDAAQDAGEDSGLSDWLIEIGLPHVDTGIAMRRGTPTAPQGGFRRFGLVTQALG
ncbi:GNAT family N-acetyltransferase [Aquibium sp. LZ166]|uniref:GNAT family N-acetyltransferase n=1 Tax=Aquibium pacificus TaxID=3153579 RepID=A0ABV3SKS6_9HYPH